LYQLHEVIDDETFDVAGVDVLFLEGGGNVTRVSTTRLSFDELLVVCEYYVSVAALVAAVSVVANLRVVCKMHVVDTERGAIVLEHVNALRIIEFRLRSCAARGLAFRCTSRRKVL
jgi:hypothetical protein